MGFFLIIVGVFPLVIKSVAFQDKRASKRLFFLGVHFY